MNDWFDDQDARQNVPMAPNYGDDRSAPTGDAFQQEATRLSQALLGRAPTAAELDGYRRVGGIDSIGRMMASSPEAVAYQKAHAQPTTAQANRDLLGSLDEGTLRGYTAENSTPAWFAASQSELARRTAGASGAPSGLSATRQHIWDNFHSAQNKNPIRDPNETDYAYWEGKYGSGERPPEYWDQRMFDQEGQGSNAGHNQQGPPSFAQMMGPQFSQAPMNPYTVPPPQFSERPSFAQMMTAPPPFVPYQMGRRM